MSNSQDIANRIKQISKEKGKTVKSLLEECQLGKNTVDKIANGTNIGFQALEIIADCLDVSVDYLLGRDEQQKNSTPDTNVRSAVIEKLNQLPDSQLDRLLGYLEALAEE